jgi:metal-sulfur cluster biosynthetic enzyme
MNSFKHYMQYVVAAVFLLIIVVLLAAMAYSSSIKRSYHWTKPPDHGAPPPLTEDHIRFLLAQVHDSEVGANIVDLGLVYGIRLPSPGTVEVTMTLTTPYCPFSREIVDDIQKTLMADQAINDARLRIVFEPAWSWSRVDKRVRDRIFKQVTAAEEKVGNGHD